MGNAGAGRRFTDRSAASRIDPRVATTAAEVDDAVDSRWLQQLLTTCSSEAIARHDRGGRILWVSPNAHLVFGRPKSALLASDLRELIPDAVPVTYRHALEQSLSEVAANGASTCTYRVRAQDGTERWVETFFRGAFDRQGKLVEIHSLTRDIERLKGPLDEMAARERQWLGAMDMVPVALLHVNSMMHVISANRCATELFSCPVSALMGRNAVGLLCAPGSEAAADLNRLAKRPSYLETELWSEPLGRWLSVAFYPAHDPNGRLQAALFRLLDITPRKRTEEKLHRSLTGMKRLAARLQSIREEERARISREIHDELGHQLTGISLTLGWLRDRIEPERELLVRRVDSMLTMLDGTLRSIRRISTDLRPAVLDHLGLAAAIRWQCSEFQQRTGIRVNLQLSQNPPQVEGDTATTLFRILQEALTNVARHAGAQRVTVSLRGTERQLTLTIEDDGRGFDVEAPSDDVTCGLFGMEQRAHELGGQFTVTSANGRGTRITVRVPVTRA
jgi:PAS domain S-box-containing protein